MVLSRTIVLCGALILAGCRQQEAPAPAPASPALFDLKVATMSYPADWLTARVGGASVHRSLILPAGEDPPLWQPSGEVVAGLGDFDLIVANGAGYEAWMSTASLPAAKVVDTARGASLIELAGVTHSHGKAGAHTHAGTDPHTWADPNLFARQAAAVRDALARLAPEGRAQLDQNLKGVEGDLAALDQAYVQVMKVPADMRLAQSHPAFNYLARRYGVPIQTFTFDPDEVPTADQLVPFRTFAAAGGRVVLLWESEPLEVVKAAFPAGVTHVTIDPLEQAPEGEPYDYLGQARANVSRFEALFRGPDAARAAAEAAPQAPSEPEGVPAPGQ